MTLFYLFAAVAVVASLLVIAQRNPIYSVLLLIASFGALSGLYILLDAPFVAVTQIIVYAGAIMVLFLFVVMLLNAPHEDTEFDERIHPLLRPGPMRFGALLAMALHRRADLGADQRRRRIGRVSRRRRQLGRGDRHGSCSPTTLSVRGDLDPDSRRDGRRGGAGAPRRRGGSGEARS